MCDTLIMEQALGSRPNTDEYWTYYQTIPSAQAKVLAEKLGLTPQQ